MRAGPLLIPLLPCVQESAVAKHFVALSTNAVGAPVLPAGPSSR